MAPIDCFKHQGAKERLCFKSRALIDFSIGQRPAKRSVKYFIPLSLFNDNDASRLYRCRQRLGYKIKTAQEAMEAVRNRDLQREVKQKQQLLHNAGKNNLQKTEWLSRTIARLGQRFKY